MTYPKHILVLFKCSSSCTTSSQNNKKKKVHVHLTSIKVKIIKHKVYPLLERFGFNQLLILSQKTFKLEWGFSFSFFKGLGVFRSLYIFFSVLGVFWSYLGLWGILVIF